MSAVFTNRHGLTVRTGPWGEGKIAVECHDDCLPEAWSLHCGPWDDLAEAERRAKNAKPKRWAA